MRPHPGPLEYRVLGAVDVLLGGRVVEVGSQKQRAILAVLVLTAGEAVSSDRLIDAIWPEGPPASAEATLRGLVARLRKTLGTQPGEPGERIRGRAAGYVLDADGDEVDATRFLRLAAAGRAALGAGDADGAATSLEAALAAWRGPALGDLAGWPFAQVDAARLEESRLATVEELAAAELARGRPAEALARLDPHTAAHPLRERGWQHKILALYRLGRQADALRAYQEIRRRLADELGLEPNPELKALEVDVLAQRPELLSRSAAGGPPAPVHPSRRQDTAAFLFTDIEASTSSWERDGEGMALDLAGHDELLAGVCEEWRGEVFSHTGDGLCAAFPTAADAIGAAIAGQLALAGQAWQRERPLKVRMAVHAGAAQRRAGNWFGPTLNRTARLLSVGWGGQVLCSAAAADLAADQLPAGTGLVDLGEQHLVDLATPVRVYQLNHPRLPADFPPLRTAGGSRHNLPATLSAFVGRHSELAETAALLGRSRLVTLAGPGGAGKTRMALEAAGAASSHFPDGAWLVELAPLRDPDLVAPAVAGAVGLDPSGLAAGDRPFAEALCDQLRHRRLLVVLDNCEHLIESAARLVGQILARCPDVVVLATSREVLSVPGETVIRVGPLTLPSEPAAQAVPSPDDLAASDAVTLFCLRAAESQPGFALSAANTAAVARICHRLDGLPLALELAAARMRLLGAQAIADRLDDRFRLLGHGPRTASARHQTLEAAIAWSFDLLSPLEQAVLRRLSVFPATFSLEAAEAVAAGADAEGGTDGYDVIDCLGRLADKSLLVPVSAENGEVRHRLLETVRQFAAAQLASAGEAGSTERRHRDWFLDVTDGFDMEMALAGKWHRWVWAERENLRAALGWSLADGDASAVLGLAAPLAVYWIFTGSADTANWLERAVTTPGDGHIGARVVCRVALAYVLVSLGHPHDGRPTELLEEAVALALVAGDERSGAWARLVLAEFAFVVGRVEEAETLLQQSVEAFQGLESMGEGSARHSQAWACLARGDLPAARQYHDRCVEMLAADPDHFLTVQVLPLAALLSALAGDHDAAGLTAERAVAYTRSFPGTQTLGMALCRSAEVAILGGHQERAVGLLAELLGLLRDLGTHRWVAEALELAAVLLADSQPAPASLALGVAADLRQVAGDRHPVPAFAALVDAARCTVEAALGPGSVEAHRAAGQPALPASLAEIRAVLMALDRPSAATSPIDP